MTICCNSIYFSDCLSGTLSCSYLYFYLGASIQVAVLRFLLVYSTFFRDDKLATRTAGNLQRSLLQHTREGMVLRSGQKGWYGSVPYTGRPMSFRHVGVLFISFQLSILIFDTTSHRPTIQCKYPKRQAVDFFVFLISVSILV